MFEERKIRKHGESATAKVLSMEMHKHTASTNDYRRYDYVLEVRPSSQASFQVQMSAQFFIIQGKPQTYDEVRVKFDPKSHETIFDLEGDPRYDTDAMNARSEQLRKETAEIRAAAAARGVPEANAPMWSGMIPNVQSSAAPSPTAVVDAIAKLAELRASGVLSAEQFEALKAKLIAGI